LAVFAVCAITLVYVRNRTVGNVQNDLSAQLIESAEKAADLDPRVLDAYIHQCTAEAQEGMNVFSPLPTCFLFPNHLYLYLFYTCMGLPLPFYMCEYMDCMHVSNFFTMMMYCLVC